MATQYENLREVSKRPRQRAGAHGFTPERALREERALRTDGNGTLRSRAGSLLETGQAVLCNIVILELWNGAHGGQERSSVRRITETLDRVPTTQTDWKTANTLATVCREKGAPNKQRAARRCGVSNAAALLMLGGASAYRSHV